MHIIMIFTKDNIEQISKTLGTEPKIEINSYVWNVSNSTNGQKIIVSLYNDVDFNCCKGALVSVQSVHGYFELHNISNFLVFEPDELIFIRNEGDNISTLVVGREATCSLYSNISRDMLKQDLTELEPPVLLSAMQIAIIDSLLE